MLSIS
jgi:hypothetical protein